MNHHSLPHLSTISLQHSLSPSNTHFLSLHTHRWGGADRARVPEGPQGVRTCAGRLQVWQRGPGRSGTHLPERPVPRLGADLPPRPGQQEGTHQVTGQ